MGLDLTVDSDSPGVCAKRVVRPSHFHRGDGQTGVSCSDVGRGDAVPVPNGLPGSLDGDISVGEARVKKDALERREGAAPARHCSSRRD